MRLDNERGAALITALLVMSSFSLLTAAIVFTVQTDVQISANYKYGQQAYYVANAGIQNSLSWFRSPAYVPYTGAGYDATKVPVQYNGGAVTLSGKPGVTSNYPDSATSTAFYSSLGDIELKAGNPPDDKNKGAYQASATLLRSRRVRLIDPDTFALYDGNLERWRLDSTGFWGTSANPIGRSEVSAVIERQAIPFYSKALWVANSATFGGGNLVDSYDPSLGAYGGSNIGTNGDIGSNGDITIKGAGTRTNIQGDVWYGSGGCTGCTPTNATITGQLSSLVEPKLFPPIAPFTVDLTNNYVKNDGLTYPLPEGTYGAIDLKNHTNITLTGGTYYIDSLSLSGNSTLTIARDASVKLYVKSNLDANGGAIVNINQDPANFQLIYSGTNTATLNGGNGFYGTVYAPNALLKLTGSADFYGSFMAQSASIQGGAQIHYDSGLLRDYLLPRPFKIMTWTQKNY
jgi:hypothetical protein